MTAGLDCLTEHPTVDERVQAAVEVAEGGLTEAVTLTVLRCLARPFLNDDERDEAIADLLAFTEDLQEFRNDDRPAEHGAADNGHRAWELVNNRLLARRDDAAGRLVVAGYQGGTR